MENSNANGEKDMWCEQLVDSLNYLRDVLVEASQELRELLLNLDTPMRAEADEKAKEILKTLQR